MTNRELPGTMAAMSMGRRALPALVFTLLLPLTEPAWANDVAAAEALFNDARALMAKGDTARACEKFKESQRLDPSAGTSLNLARCYEQLGRTASAWGEYQVAERMATAQGRSAIAEEARRKARELGQSLGTLNVEVTEPVEGLEVQLGETTLAAAALGSKIPTDAGNYTLRVTAPGYQPYEVAVTISDGNETNVSIPKLVAESAAPEGAPAEEAASAERPSSQIPAPEQSPEPSSDHTLAYVVGGSGLALLGGGVVLGFLAKGENTEARRACGGGTDGCPPETMGPAENADTLATAGTVVGAVGVVGIAVGAFLLFSGGSSEPGPESALRGLSVSVDPGYAGCGFTGVWP